MKRNALPFACLVLLAACSAPAPPEPPAAAKAPEPPAEPVAHDAATPAHWSYEGDEGPSHWGELGADNAACATGHAQSPIDLTKAGAADLPNLAFHYQPSQLHVLDNGHTLQFDYDPGSYVEIDGTRYELLQFHVHAPSEHAVDGKLADAEIHLVHRDAAGHLAVVGLLVHAGKENAALADAWAHLPAGPGPAQTVDAQVDAAALLPPTQAAWRYDGSLTTPPCTEGVKWSVMETPIEMSQAQLDAFTHLVHANNRPVQPLDGRALAEDTTP
jgi:carbonic anhydrase